MPRLRITDKVRAKSEPSAAPPSFPMLLNSSRMRFTGTGQRISGGAVGEAHQLDKQEGEKQRAEKGHGGVLVAEHHEQGPFFPARGRSGRCRCGGGMRATASFCSTWSRVPRPSTIPERTVSLAWENRQYGPPGRVVQGSRSNRGR